MDLSKLTIPPELFYSKSAKELWKPRHTVTRVPVEITQKLTKTKTKPKVSLKQKRFHNSYKSTRTPELGRIGRIKRSLFKKKLIKKKPAEKPVKAALQEKSINIIDNNNIPKNLLQSFTSKQEDLELARKIKEQEALSYKRLLQEKAAAGPRKRALGSTFKFFKSKNVENEKNEEKRDLSDDDNDLVPEIQDYSETQVKPSQPVQELPIKLISSFNATLTPPRSEKTLNNSIDIIPFEDVEEEPLDDTAMKIESLLRNLDEGDTAPVEKANYKENTLDGLISTLEGSQVNVEATTEEDETVEDNPVKTKKPVLKQKIKVMGLGKNQMQIDAGQKKFGLVECKSCGFSYNTNVPEDEKMHMKHHERVTCIPRFRGWSNEKAMEIKDWKEKNGRIIHLPPYHKNLNSVYVTEIIGRMQLEFGLLEDYKSFHVYLAVYDMNVVGLATVKESVVAKKDNQEKQVRLGIQRLYVRPEFRRKGVAKAILKTITILHHKGDLLKLQEDVAFSSPTEDGKKLIKNVVGSDKVFTFSS